MTAVVGKGGRGLVLVVFHMLLCGDKTMYVCVEVSS